MVRLEGLFNTNSTNSLDEIVSESIGWHAGSNGGIEEWWGTVERGLFGEWLTVRRLQPLPNPMELVTYSTLSIILYCVCENIYSIDNPPTIVLLVVTLLPISLLPHQVYQHFLPFLNSSSTRVCSLGLPHIFPNFLLRTVLYIYICIGL